MLHTRLCDLLSIRYPIIAAPMGPDLTGPDLVAVVGNAGGLGILQAQLDPPDMLRGKLRRVRELSDAPFGVNCLLQFPCEQIVDVCIAERLAPAVADREAHTA